MMLSMISAHGCSRTLDRVHGLHRWHPIHTHACLFVLYSHQQCGRVHVGRRGRLVCRDRQRRGVCPPTCIPWSMHIVCDHVLTLVVWFAHVIICLGRACTSCDCVHCSCGTLHDCEEYRLDTHMSIFLPLHRLTALCWNSLRACVCVVCVWVVCVCACTALQ